MIAIETSAVQLPSTILNIISLLSYQASKLTGVFNIVSLMIESLGIHWLLK